MALQREGKSLGTTWRKEDYDDSAAKRETFIGKGTARQK